MFRFWQWFDFQIRSISENRTASATDKHQVIASVEVTVS